MWLKRKVSPLCVAEIKMRSKQYQCERVLALSFSVLTKSVANRRLSPRHNRDPLRKKTIERGKIIQKFFKSLTKNQAHFLLSLTSYKHSSISREMTGTCTRGLRRREDVPAENERNQRIRKRREIKKLRRKLAKMREQGDISEIERCPTLPSQSRERETVDVSTLKTEKKYQSKWFLCFEKKMKELKEQFRKSLSKSYTKSKTIKYDNVTFPLLGIGRFGFISFESMRLSKGTFSHDCYYQRKKKEESEKSFKLLRKEKSIFVRGWLRHWHWQSQSHAGDCTWRESMSSIPLPYTHSFLSFINLFFFFVCIFSHTRIHDFSTICCPVGWRDV